MAQSFNKEKTVRVAIQLPEETRDYLYTIAEDTGLKGSHFMTLALITGARALGRSLAPEKHLPPEILQTFSQYFGVDPTDLLKALVAQHETVPSKKTKK